jgi:hypothetical protein
MNVEFELKAAATLEKDARNAENAGSLDYAAKCYDIAAKKYRALAGAIPSRSAEMLAKANECERAKTQQAEKKVVTENNPRPKNTKTEEQTPKPAIKPIGGDGQMPSLEQALDALNQLIGLREVKTRINEWVALYRNNKIREQNGLPVRKMSHHMVFVGSPGTGKTTVVRLMGQIFYALGIVSKGQLVEVKRGDLVGEYVGHTAVKTQAVIDSAQGGVLFVDEAYELANDSGNDFGKEAIETLMNPMDDDDVDFALIVAGYEQPMKKFLKSNRGLCSRFKVDPQEIGIDGDRSAAENKNRVLSPNYIIFEDYTGEEMYQIFNLFCKKNGYILSDDAVPILQDYLNKLYENRGENFANGRTVRNLFDMILVAQGKRLAKISNPTVEQLMLLTKEDLPI